MRVLFAIVPAPAHVYPVAPLAWALQLAGHEVLVASQPDNVDTITAAGLTAVPLGERNLIGSPVSDADHERLDRIADALELGPEEENLRVAIRKFMLNNFALCYPSGTPVPASESFSEELVAFSRSWRPDLVIWDPLCFHAPVAARAAGAAHARILHAADHFGWARQRFLERQGEGPDLMAQQMAPTLSRLGVPFSEDLLTGQWTLDLRPPSTRLPVRINSLPLRRMPYNDVHPLPSWQHASRPERPRICLTLGVSRRKYFPGGNEHPIAEFFEAAADLDVELVATLDAGQLETVKDDVPDNVRILDYASLSALLPSCSVVIHHGGAGTLATATAHRIPQLVVPAVGGSDRAETAQYVAAHGAGLVVEKGRTSPGELRAQLVRLLEEQEFKDGAGRLREEWLKSPGPAEILPVLEALTVQHRGSPAGVR